MPTEQPLTAGQGDFDDAQYYLWKIDSTDCETDADRIVMGLRAIAHATLAQTAVTALRGANDMPAGDFNSWVTFLAQRAKPYNL